MRGYPLPRWGNLRRTTPFSSNFGFERGTPLDRYYSARFFERNRGWITGDVLEIQGSGYTSRFGKNIRKADSIDINPVVNPTWVCDLAHADIIASDQYDCFLLPHTLSFLRNLDCCLREAIRIVKPGGVILATASCFVPLIPDGPDYWRFSAEGWKELVEKLWPGCEIRVEAFGNCLAAIAAMMGLALEELDPCELDRVDRQYPVVISLFCRKVSSCDY